MEPRDLAGLHAVGWREWLALPDLGLIAVRAKVDTGATTSALHAFDIAVETDGGAHVARFTVQPFLRRKRLVVACEAPVVDVRRVTSSSGHVEKRIVVGTRLRLGVRTGAPEWEIELTLTDRGTMRYPMLLGREAMAGRIVVDPGASYRLGHVASPRAFYT